MIIERSAQSAARVLGGDPVQETEADLGLMQQHRKAQNFSAHVFGDEKNGPKPLLERIAQLVADFFDFFAADFADAAAQDGFYLLQRILVDWQHIVINTANFQHGFGFLVPASQTIRSTAWANVRPAR
jgi:hypothetical protein